MRSSRARSNFSSIKRKELLLTIAPGRAKNTRRAFTFRPLPRASRRASVAWKSVRTGPMCWRAPARAVETLSVHRQLRDAGFGDGGRGIAMISIGVPTPGVTSDYHELPRLLGSDGWAADPDGAEGHGLARLSGGRGAVGAARGRCRFFVAVPAHHPITAQPA